MLSHKFSNFILSKRVLHWSTSLIIFILSGIIWITLRIDHQFPSDQSALKGASAVSGHVQDEVHESETIGATPISSGVLRDRLESIEASLGRGEMSLEQAICSLAFARESEAKSGPVGKRDPPITARAVAALVIACDGYSNAAHWTEQHLGEPGLKRLMPFLLLAVYWDRKEMSDVVELSNEIGTGLGDGLALITRKGLASPIEFIGHFDSLINDANSEETIWEIWAGTHPSAAYRCFRQDNGDHKNPVELVAPYFSNLIREQPVRALEKIKQLSETHPLAADKILTSNIRGFDQLGIMAEAFDAVSVRGKTAAFSEILWDLTYYDPQEALAWSKRMEATDGFEFGPEYVYDQWIKSEPLGASKALATEEESPMKDRMSAEIVRSIAHVDQESALSWANSIENLDLRDQTLSWMAENIETFQSGSE